MAYLAKNDPDRQPIQNYYSQAQIAKLEEYAEHHTSSREEILSMKLYVDAVNGLDVNNGRTLQTAVKTLHKAQELVREIAQTVNNHVTVYIREGVYTLGQPLSFDGNRDSLPNGNRLIFKNYDNEVVTVSGGFALNNWTASEYGTNIVKTLVPNEFVITRDLYVNGQPTVRAKTDGSLAGSVTWDGGLDITYLDGGELAESGEKDIEIVLKEQWMDFRGSVVSARVENNSSILTLDQHFHSLMGTVPYLPKTSENLWWIENAMVFLDRPGEWYYDSNKKAIYYMLRSGETADSLSAFAGVSEKLITSDNDSTLKNITFEGLTFSNTTWLRPGRNGGFVCRQAAFYSATLDSGVPVAQCEYWHRPEAAITLFKTEGINFINNKFINLGNTAIDMHYSKNSLVSGNLFTNSGGSALILGGFNPYEDHSPEDESMVTENCEISNNYIHNIGTNMKSACGITIGYSRNIDIINNTLHDLPYSGISQGWGWGIEEFGQEPKSSGGRIANNYIYNVMMELVDGGAIYTLSRRDGLVIENNYIHNVMFAGTAIYQDNRSAGYTIRNNVLRNNFYNFVQNSYNTDIYDNYLDILNETQTDSYAGSPKIVFYGWRMPNGQLNVDSRENTEFSVLGRAEWLTQNNSYSIPTGDTTAKENAIIAAAGVEPEYKNRFGIS